ncbi:MAE_28990/MAE_18760 family HEPN-like nuclease [Tsukamurella soli]|uniref:RiboL-PSP-HEPN domain-containing protein n=1 Tax=Tsukamurella soli TaxID=644556 RepID=A0ABP8KB70_9ACTN
MKVRTLEKLEQLISDDVSWRKKELSVLDGLIGNGRTPASRAALRASIPLLYAHWEGAIKNICHWYLCYLAAQALPLDEFKAEIVGYTLKGKFAALSNSRRPIVFSEAVRMIREEADKRARIPTERDAIITESNLSYAVLCDLLMSIGCDTSGFDRYQDLIDSQLLNIRNRIAHGEDEYPRLPEWSDLKEVIVSLIDQVATQVLNASVTGQFRRVAPSPAAG